MWKFATVGSHARFLLWQESFGKALDEVEAIPGTYLRHAWYIGRTPRFHRSCGHARSNAVIDALRSRTIAHRTRLETVVDKSPPSETIMRASSK